MIQNHRNHDFIGSDKVDNLIELTADKGPLMTLIVNCWVDQVFVTVDDDFTLEISLLEVAC